MLDQGTSEFYSICQTTLPGVVRYEDPTCFDGHKNIMSVIKDLNDKTFDHNCNRCGGKIRSLYFKCTDCLHQNFCEKCYIDDTSTLRQHSPTDSSH